MQGANCKGWLHVNGLNMSRNGLNMSRNGLKMMWNGQNLLQNGPDRNLMEISLHSDSDWWVGGSSACSAE